MKRRFREVVDSFRSNPNDRDLRSLVSRSRDPRFTVKLAIELFPLCVSENQREGVFKIFRKKLQTVEELEEFRSIEVSGRPIPEHWVHRAEMRFRKKYPKAAKSLDERITQVA